MPPFGSGWTKRLFEQLLTGSDLQGFPYRDNYPCGVIPVRRAEREKTCYFFLFFSAKAAAAATAAAPAAV
jgi:hypothetical protein